MALLTARDLVGRGVLALEKAQEYVSPGDIEGQALIASAYARLAEALDENTVVVR